MSERPVVAILVAHYLPGSKGGGPIRSVSNLVAALGDEFDFRILTTDRDLGDLAPYPDVPINAWTTVGKARVLYLGPDRTNRAGVLAALIDLRPDLVYVQSFFSPLFSIAPRLAKRKGLLSCPLLVAPRGEFSPGALALKARKKRLFIRLGKMLRVDQDVVWHATAPEEAEDIRRTIGPSARVLVAPPLPTPDDRPLAVRTKESGRLEAVFLSRISPKKNLTGAIEMVANIEGVRLTVYGPKEDAPYWTHSQELARRLGVEMIDGGSLPADRVRGALESAHVFLFPTLGENYGHVIMESLTAGTPVLLSDQTPWRGLVEKGVGWDLPLADTEGFRAALEALRAMNQSSYDTLSRQAYDYARALREEPQVLEANRELLRSAFMTNV